MCLTLTENLVPNVVLLDEVAKELLIYARLVDDLVPTPLNIHNDV